MKIGAFAQVATDAKSGRRMTRSPSRVGRSTAQSLLDPAVGHLLLALDALDVVLAAVVEQARPLEALYQRTVTHPAENPLDELRELEVNGRPLVTFSPDPHQTRGLDAVLDVPGAVGAAVARVDGRPAPGPRRGRAGTLQVTGTRHVFSGHADHCPALAAWGDNARAVLAPALSALHATEDQIRIELGKCFRMFTGADERATARLGLTRGALYGFGAGHCPVRITESVPEPTLGFH